MTHEYKEAEVSIIRPVLYENVWYMPGQKGIIFPSEFADEQESFGAIDIDKKDGVPVVWGSCCDKCQETAVEVPVEDFLK